MAREAPTTPGELWRPSAAIHKLRWAACARCSDLLWHVRGQRFNPIHPGLIRAIAGADVVHCHQPHTMAAELSALLARATGRRVFASDLGGGGWGFSSRIDTEGWFHGHLHISKYSRQNAGHEGRPRAEVIYGGVDTELFSPDLFVSERAATAVYVGRLMPHKGVNDLIEALPEGMKLELIGRPYHNPFLSELKRLASHEDGDFPPRLRRCGNPFEPIAARFALCCRVYTGIATARNPKCRNCSVRH